MISMRDTGGASRNQQKNPIALPFFAEPKCFDVVNKDVKQRLTSPSELIEEWVETRFFFGRKKLPV